MDISITKCENRTDLETVEISPGRIFVARIGKPTESASQWERTHSCSLDILSILAEDTQLAVKQRNGKGTCIRTETIETLRIRRANDEDRTLLSGLR
jgi:hypothetical protein